MYSKCLSRLHDIILHYYFLRRKYFFMFVYVCYTLAVFDLVFVGDGCLYTACIWTLGARRRNFHNTQRRNSILSRAPLGYSADMLVMIWYWFCDLWINIRSLKNFPEWRWCWRFDATDNTATHKFALDLFNELNTKVSHNTSQDIDLVIIRYLELVWHLRIRPQTRRIQKRSPATKLKFYKHTQKHRSGHQHIATLHTHSQTRISNHWAIWDNIGWSNLGRRHNNFRSHRGSHWKIFLERNSTRGQQNPSRHAQTHHTEHKYIAREGQGKLFGCIIFCCLITGWYR